MERSVAVINARVEEIGQHIVAVRSTDQPAERQSHSLCDIRRKNVTEVSRRDAHIDPLAVSNLLVLDKVAVRGNIINDLRRKPAEVDRICRRQEFPLRIERVGDVLVGEYRLDSRLRVVEIAPDCADTDVSALLRLHLPLLDVAHAALGVKHLNADTRHILISLKRRLTGVAARRDEYQRIALFAGLFKTF